MNNKGASQTAQMRRLICAFVVSIWHKTRFRMTISPITSINCLHKKKAENQFFVCTRFWSLALPRGMDPVVSSHGMKADLQRYFQIWKLSDDRLWRYTCFRICNVKLCGNYTNAMEEWSTRWMNRKIKTIYHSAYFICRGYKKINTTKFTAANSV